MRMISYAQHGEDVLLHRLFPKGHKGFYIDIGANHPTYHSVTRHFYDLGWRGINVEPVSRICAMLREARPDDLNLEFAISDHVGRMTLVEPSDSLGMSTLNLDFARGLRADGYSCVERSVSVTTLAQLCEQHVGDQVIDFLKIDVEGHESAVILGGDWRRWRPRVLVVEATVIPEAWEPMLLAADYLLATSDGVNRYYLRAEDAELQPRLSAPLWVSDTFLPVEVAEAQASLESQLAGTRAGLEHARYEVWEARQKLAQSEARERVLREELQRLQTLEINRGRVRRLTARAIRLLSGRSIQVPVAATMPESSARCAG